MTLLRRALITAFASLTLVAGSASVADAAVQDYPCGKTVTYGQFIYYNNCLKIGIAVQVRGPGASYITCIPARSLLKLDRGSASTITWTNKACF